MPSESLKSDDEKPSDWIGPAFISERILGRSN